MRAVYIRFGEIPADERSSIYGGDAGVIGNKNGVSVFESMDGKIVLPLTISNAAINDLWWFRSQGRPVYEVEGDLVGVGACGEPVIRNVKVIRELK